jgi:hypothetical protein
LVGTLRHAQHRRVPEMQQALARRHSAMAPRTVWHLLERDEALVALALAAPLRLQRVTTTHGRVILALDGRQPAGGHEGLWGLRDCLSAEVLLARSLLSATPAARADLLRAVRQALRVPIVGGISAGQSSSRCAVATAWPQVPHQLGHCHSRREAAKPVSEADRHAQKERNKHVRGGRPLERQLDTRTAPAAEVMRGSGSAGRRALTDDGHPPRAASGLKRSDRLTAISTRLERVAKRGPCLSPWAGSRRCSTGA